jgi:membrane protein YqaA with SNARE-associated domain
MTPLLIALGCIFAVNLLPAFGPPTWALIVFFRLNSGIDLAPLVIGGAIAAASGRLVLAHGARALRGHFSPERRASLAAAEELLVSDRRRAAGGLALFAVSPVPSAQLFVAAGLLTVPLLPLTAAFFAGRLVSYSIYAGGAELAQQSLGGALTGAFSSPWGLALQAAMLLAIVALLRVDWSALLVRRRARSAAPDADVGAAPDRVGGSVVAALAAHPGDQPPAAAADVGVGRDPVEAEAPARADARPAEHDAVLGRAQRDPYAAAAELDHGPAAAADGLSLVPADRGGVDADAGRGGGGHGGGRERGGGEQDGG